MLPRQVEAGRYAEHNAAIVTVLSEVSTEMVVRLKVAADGVRDTEWTVTGIEQLNEEDAARIDPDGPPRGRPER